MDNTNDEEKILGNLIEAIVLVLKEKTEIESFEEYAHQLRVRVYDEIPGYKERFFKGYQSILKILETQG